MAKTYRATLTITAVDSRPGIILAFGATLQRQARLLTKLGNLSDAGCVLEFEELKGGREPIPELPVNSETTEET